MSTNVSAVCLPTLSFRAWRSNGAKNKRIRSFNEVRGWAQIVATAPHLRWPAFALCAPATAQELALCGAPLEARSLEHAPVHFRERIAQGKPLKIVAIGSSSTSGAGASSSAATYPSRLEAELKAQLPGLPITVLNKGIGGEEAPANGGALRGRRVRGSARSGAVAGRQQFGAARSSHSGRGDPSGRGAPEGLAAPKSSSSIRNMRRRFWPSPASNTPSTSSRRPRATPRSACSIVSRRCATGGDARRCRSTSS